MADYDHPLQFGSEVESEVLRTGLSDFPLAHGCGLVADSSKLRPLIPSCFGESVFREVYGVTVVSIDHDAEVTLRTATFGTENPAFVAQIDAMGVSTAMSVGGFTDKVPVINTVMTSQLVLHTVSDQVREGMGCTVGGTLLRRGDHEGTIEPFAFVSEAFAAFSEKVYKSRVSKVGFAIAKLVSSKARSDVQKLEEQGITQGQATIINQYSSITSAARKRAAPVVIKRPFMASAPRTIRATTVQ